MKEVWPRDKIETRGRSAPVWKSNVEFGHRADAVGARNFISTQVDKILPVQVALQWVRAKGAVPLPAVKNQKHAQAIIGCQGWALEENEVAVLDAALPRSVPKFARLR